jgi:hypothetical protein
MAEKPQSVAYRLLPLIVGVVGIAAVMYFTRTPAPATPAATPRPAPLVSRATIDATWPLTVDEGTIICNGDAFLLRTNQGLYALNGTARGRMDTEGWKDIREITKSDPNNPSLILSVQPLVDRALDYCR